METLLGNGVKVPLGKKVGSNLTLRLFPKRALRAVLVGRQLAVAGK